MPFIDDCGKFPTDCFIFHKQNTTLKFNSQLFYFNDWEKKSVFLRAWTWHCFFSQKSQRLSLMYHSRTFWFQILCYNPDYTLLFLYAYIACTSIVPRSGCHCSRDICRKPDWITLRLCQLPMQEPIHMWPRCSCTWLQESLSMSSEHSLCPPPTQVRSTSSSDCVNPLIYLF